MTIIVLDTVLKKISKKLMNIAKRQLAQEFLLLPKDHFINCYALLLTKSPNPRSSAVIRRTFIGGAAARSATGETSSRTVMSASMCFIVVLTGIGVSFIDLVRN